MKKLFLGFITSIFVMTAFKGVLILKFKKSILTICSFSLIALLLNFYPNKNIYKAAAQNKKEHVNFFVREIFDDRIAEELMGAHHHVFIAKVEGLSPNFNEEKYKTIVLGEEKSLPITTYHITPLYNIKGELDIHEGIYIEEAYKETDQQIINMLSRPPFKIGDTYLIFARISGYSDDNKLILAAGMAQNTIQAIDVELDLSKNDNIRWSDQKAVDIINYYIDAYENEILIRSDVASNRTYNSYKSLDSEQKLKLKEKSKNFLNN